MICARTRAATDRRAFCAGGRERGAFFFWRALPIVAPSEYQVRRASHTRESVVRVTPQAKMQRNQIKVFRKVANSSNASFGSFGARQMAWSAMPSKCTPGDLLNVDPGAAASARYDPCIAERAPRDAPTDGIDGDDQSVAGVPDRGS